MKLPYKNKLLSAVIRTYLMFYTMKQQYTLYIESRKGRFNGSTIDHVSAIFKHGVIVNLKLKVLHFFVLHIKTPVNYNSLFKRNVRIF
jgi:hypothetical protein